MINKESLHIPERLVFPPAWVGLIPFAQWLTAISKPEVFVELGVHTGNSFCSICETLKRKSINFDSFAVDTWEGDEQAGFYKDEVFKELKEYVEKTFDNNVVLIRSTFDNAEKLFKDKSIDLLHIDGLHTYEAVKNDYKTWLPKMSDRGIIMFHDIAVKDGDFGVWKLWEEIKNDYPSFELHHSNGLGVLMIGNKQPEELVSLVSQDKIQKELIQNLYSALSERIQSIYTISSQVKELADYKSQLADYKSQLADLNQTILNQEMHINELKLNIDNIIKSVSWRVTRPLRKVQHLLSDQ